MSHLERMTSSHVMFSEYRSSGFVGFIPRMIPMTLTLSQPSTTIKRPGPSGLIQIYDNLINDRYKCLFAWTSEGQPPRALADLPETEFGTWSIFSTLDLH